MCLQYAVTHEDFAWSIRGEPGVVGAFEKAYNTKDLIVSFDAVNFGFPKSVFSNESIKNLLTKTQSYRHPSQQTMATPRPRPCKVWL